MPFTPSSVSLSDFASTKREATRPVAARTGDFAQQFDDDTLFFDCFRSPRGTEVVFLGPALFNLRDAVERATFRADGDGPAFLSRLRILDRHAQIWVDAPLGAAKLSIQSPLGRLTVPVGVNQSELFAGRRVLLTLSRNNPLPWILDWIRFNRDVHGADAVLFYDNGSDLYTASELESAIAGVPGVKQGRVVRWPFKYGPQGHDAVRFWDSDFCQLGAWEHARWCFLSRARSVMNSDVDELVVGRDSAFSVAERSLSGIAVYGGRWIVEAAGERQASSNGTDERRHRDFTVLLRRKLTLGRFWRPTDANACRPKWTVVPARTPASAQWHVHGIKGWPAAYFARRDLAFRHFRPISTNWKYHRGAGVPFDPGVHEVDVALIDAMSRVSWDR